MKILPLTLGLIGAGALLLLTRDKAKASSSRAPGDSVTLNEIFIYGDPTAPQTPANIASNTDRPITYQVGDEVRVLTLGRVGKIIDFPAAIDPRYPPVGVQIPGFPYQIFAAQDLQHLR